MGTIVSKIAEQIEYYGSLEAYMDALDANRPKSLIPKSRNAPPPRAINHIEDKPNIEPKYSADEWESAKLQVAQFYQCGSFLELVESMGLEQSYYRLAAEIFVNDVINKHAPQFHNWVNHQVVAGRTSHKLWQDYLKENKLPFPFFNP
jgi:hypothetical protein